MRTFIYLRHSFGQNGTEPELLRKSVEDRDDTVIAAFSDDPAILGKGKNAGWNVMLGDLNNIDQIVVGCAGDLPGRKIDDLLRILDLLRHHGVGLRLNHENIETRAGTAATLDLIIAYRATKLSEAIRHGISEARRAGKVIGRPAVPYYIRRTIQIAVANGGGIRPTARKFNVSPASVINILRTMSVEPERMAA